MSTQEVVPEIPAKPVIIFDGVCNLCSGLVRFLLERDPRGEFLLTSYQSPAGRRLLKRFGVDPETVATVYLVEGGRLHARSAALLRVARRLPFPWKLAAALVLVPRPWRDRLYDWIARNRYRWFGKRDTCRVPTAAERARFLET
jgi:predicted DCC family thiol-disulfide oxidoreductase YuxK